jgi:hypothetical protein
MKQSGLPNTVIYFLCLILFFAHLNAEPSEKEFNAEPSEKEFIVLRCRTAGMFSTFLGKMPL